MTIRIYFTGIVAILTMLLAGCKKEQQSQFPKAIEPKWVNLLDEDLSQWEKFIGVPHYTVPLEGYPKGDGMNGTPIGLNEDPLNVFSVQIEDGMPVLYITGQIYGGLTTKKEYGNYHLKLEFKWGQKKYEPRLNAIRDNGILYHAYGEHGAFWNVWMNSQEFQVQETDMGDYIAIGPGSDIHADYRTEGGILEWIYDPNAKLEPFGVNSNKGRCRRAIDKELPNGQWNTLELICFEDKSWHIVNGTVVMALENSRLDSLTPLTKGRIQIQSEGAEAYYRNIEIRQITEVPEAYK